MKAIRYLIVAAALGCGFVSCAQAHVSIGIGFSAPVYPVMPAVPVIAPAPVYVAPPLASPVYYGPPPVVGGYYGRPYGYGYGYAQPYGCLNCGYAYWSR